MDKTLETLPKGKEARIKAIIEQIEYVNSFSETINIVHPIDIEKLANNKTICFITHSPSFLHTFIDNNQVQTEQKFVGRIYFNSDLFNTLDQERRKGRLFAFYNLEPGFIRGVFLDHCGEFLSSLRDETIDEILSLDQPKL